MWCIWTSAMQQVGSSEAVDSCYILSNHVFNWFILVHVASQCFTSVIVNAVTIVLLIIIAGLGQVLEFMYTAKLTLSPQNVEDVLTVANFLQMQEIVNACSAYQSMANPNPSLITLDFAVGESHSFFLKSCHYKYMNPLYILMTLSLIS